MLAKKYIINVLFLCGLCYFLVINNSTNKSQNIIKVQTREHEVHLRKLIIKQNFANPPNPHS